MGFDLPIKIILVQQTATVKSHKGGASVDVKSEGVWGPPGVGVRLDIE